MEGSEKACACLDIVNEIEWDLFHKNGNVGNEVFEKLRCCTPKACVIIIDETQDLLRFLPIGDYHSILKTPYTKSLLGYGANDILDYHEYLKEQVLKELTACVSDESKYMKQLYIYVLGISCLQLVVQHNWTGPPLPGQCKDHLPSCFHSKEKFELLRKQTIDYLGKDSEDVYGLAEFTEFLLIARTILVECQHLLVDLMTLPIWQLRCNLIHQQLLEEPSTTLKTEAFAAIDKVAAFDMSNLSSDIVCQIYLECGYQLLQYCEDKRAKEQFEKALDCAGIKLHHEGALGRRTKFQQIDYSQLVIKADVSYQKEEIVSNTTDIKDHLPKDVVLDDDTLLSKTKYTEPESTKQGKLQPLHLATILAMCVYKQKSYANHELLEEEILANVELLLSQPQVWTIQTIALLLRSKYEKKSTRKKERSMLQVQQLVDQYRDSKAKVFHRLELFYSVLFPSRWTLEKELANLLRELGVIKSALEIYERLQLWEDVMTCYVVLGRYEKAEQVVRDKLSVHETPKLWCLLGDVTKDEQHYHKALELSEQRSARAHRSLGFHYLRDRKFEESVSYFQKSLEINSLQENVWFSLGCAAMFSFKLELAAKAFQWCVSVNPDNSEAWNNLSSVYVKTNQKDRAFRTFQEALKLSYDNWHVWENFLVVSIDVGAFEEVINAFHRLMDLKDKYLDVEILRILVLSVISGVEDNKGLSASRLKPNLLKLMGRITSQITSNSEVWKLYSDIYKDGQSDDEKDKFLQYLVKAHGVKMHTRGWEKNKEETERVINLTLELSQAYYEASERLPAKAIQLLSSSKMNLRGLLTKVKNNFTNMTGEVDSSLADLLSNVETDLGKIMNRIQTLKAS